MAQKPPAKKTTTKTQTKPVAAKKVAAGKAAPAKKKAPAKKPIAAPVRTRALEDKERKFVTEMLVDFNATQSAIRAGYSPKTARQQASRLLSKVNVQQALAEARKRQQERTEIKADVVLLQAARIATADARELVELRVGCCRHCYGEGHKHQRTLGEMNSDRERWIDEGKPVEEFDEQGGIGYDARKPPVDDCPECAGAGYSRVVLKDTRQLSPAAAALYAGAKEGKYGVEIQMHDKLTAVEKLFKHFGLYGKDNEQKADALASLLNRVSTEGGNGFTPVATDPEAPPARAPMGSIQADDTADDDEG